MEIIVNPERRDWPWLVGRPVFDDALIEARVRDIIDKVKAGGDRALADITAEIDGSNLEKIEVPADVIAHAEYLLDEDLREAIRTARSNIMRFHKAQLEAGIDMETMPGVRCLRRSVPINRVGIYIPGGTAPLFSTVLMLAVPAKVAGCPEIILCSPPTSEGSISPEILYTASLCGVDRVFMCGGAQAVAAMAYGTETVPRVDKIFGPGNRYVTKAKQIVSVSQVAIDMPAGPSEVMVMADSSADPDFVAADLLSQAEHGADSQSILVVDSRSLAERVRMAVDLQASRLPREDAIRSSLGNSRIVVMDSVDDMVAFANEYAAEHLIISMDEPWAIADRITAAGSIFIGNWSPESAGDYASGTNHTLPTAGWARSYSGVSTDSFLKKITIQELTPQGLQALAPVIRTMARAEGLEAHANAVKVRTDKLR